MIFASKFTSTSGLISLYKHLLFEDSDSMHEQDRIIFDGIEASLQLKVTSKARRMITKFSSI